jgi:hypothetical protein
LYFRRLQTLFDYTEPMSLHGVAHVLAPMRLAAFSGQLQPWSTLAHGNAFGLDAIATKLRTPLAWFAAARPSDRTEKISALVARGGDPDAVLFENLLAMRLGQPHADAPETLLFAAAFPATSGLVGSAGCSRAEIGVFAAGVP